MDGLLSNIEEMRINEDMCDVTVVTKEGEKHRVHSLILAGASPVFKVMVTKEFKELHSKMINLPDISDTMFRDMLDFIYTGHLKMTNENALDLFMIADRFEIPALFLSCTSYIKEHVDIANCLGVRRIAESYNQQHLFDYSTSFILQNFQAFVATDEYLDLTVDELSHLLLHDQLNVDKEEYLLDFIFCWIDHDSKRSKCVEELLQCLRFPLMNFGFIEGVFRRHPRWKENEKILEFTKSIYRGCKEIFHKSNRQPDPSLTCLTRRHRIPNTLIFLFGGWSRGRTLDVTECYNMKTKQWYVTNHLKDETEGRSYFAIELLDKNIYVIGGYNGRTYLNTIRCFNPLTKEWSSIPPMNYRRCFTSAITLADELYVIAGFDGMRRLSSVEKYSPVTNQWILLKSLNTTRSDAAAVVHNGTIYMFGGYAGDSLCSAELYDAQADTWHHIMQMQCKRSGASAISIPDENKILVIGGYNGQSRVISTEYYDPLSNTWTDGPSMSKERSNFATCVIGHKLYVIGGYTGALTLKDVEIFDLKKKTWSQGSPINCGRSAMKAVLLDNLFNSNEYFEMGEQYDVNESNLYRDVMTELQQRATNAYFQPVQPVRAVRGQPVRAIRDA